MKDIILVISKLGLPLSPTYGSTMCLVEDLEPHFNEHLAESTRFKDPRSLSSHPDP